MAFEIEEITNNVKKSVKKNPWAWGLGGGAVLLAAWYFSRGSGAGYLTSAYPESPVYSDDLEGVGSGQPGDAGGLTDTMLLDILAQMEERRQEDFYYLAEQQQGFMQSLAGMLEGYNAQRMDYAPMPEYPQPMGYNADVMAKAEYIYGTPNLIFSDKGVAYTEGQIGTLYDWAVDEQASISRGAAGTSATPASLGGSDLVVTYYPGGQVAFTPKGQDKPAQPAPTSWEQDVAARGTQASQTLSGLTGKSGTIEQQLSGMSGAQKLETLKSAGLIQ